MAETTMNVKTIKMSDMPVEIALKVFEMLNEGKVKCLNRRQKYDFFSGKTEYLPPIGEYLIVTDTEPKDLVYPDGLYYSYGYYVNYETRTKPPIIEVPMVKSNLDWWSNSAEYATWTDDDEDE